MNQSAGVVAVVPNTENLPDTLSVCRSCGAQIGRAELFCAACGHVQPIPAEISYFDVFGLPRKLRLDTVVLEQDFYRLSRRLHPDAYARATQQEQEWSLANSSLLNDAYRTLKDPIKRTEYLLRLEGIRSADEGGVKKEDRVPPDLLEEVFELNMQLDEMRMNRETGDDDPQLQKDLLTAKTNFDGQLRIANANLESLWDKWDARIDHADDPEKQAIKEEIAALLDRRRYIRNLVNSVDEALEAEI
jgi:molecular chaperone HscB